LKKAHISVIILSHVDNLIIFLTYTHIKWICW